MKYLNIILIGLFVAFAAITRLVPHPPNFTPILSIAIFCGLIFKNKYSFYIPLFAMFVSDMWLGFHNVLFFVYLAFLLIFLIALQFDKSINFKNITSISLSSSIVFFVVSNFGVWLIGYPKSFQGLYSCYMAAIPFFHNTIISTLIFSYAFLYAYKYLANYNSVLFRKS
jgi:hypothetical protein